MNVDLDCLILCILCILLTTSLTYAGQQCLSCTGVEDGTDCQHHVTCSDDKTCIMQQYVTESGVVNFDYGCASETVCHHGAGPIFGKRAEGHTIICSLCCNDTRQCNQDLKCANTGGHNPLSHPQECSDVKKANPHLTSGVYIIYPYFGSQISVSVYCLFKTDNTSWTVIQRRYNGSVDFYRNWASYKEGFGSPYGEYWLVNDVIHQLTSNTNHELRIEMMDFDEVTKYAEYTLFHVGDESNGYRLTLFNYSGDAGDCMVQDAHAGNGMKFSTYDRDNDASSSANCAVSYKGAWWYQACHCANLNGKYLAGHHASIADGIEWYHFHQHHYSLKSVIMMIRKY